MTFIVCTEYASIITKQFYKIDRLKASAIRGRAAEVRTMYEIRTVFGPGLWQSWSGSVLVFSSGVLLLCSYKRRRKIMPNRKIRVPYDYYENFDTEPYYPNNVNYLPLDEYEGDYVDNENEFMEYWAFLIKLSSMSLFQHDKMKYIFHPLTNSQLNNKYEYNNNLYQQESKCPFLSYHEKSTTRSATTPKYKTRRSTLRSSRLSRPTTNKQKPQKKKNFIKQKFSSLKKISLKKNVKKNEKIPEYKETSFNTIVNNDSVEINNNGLIYM